MSARVLVTGGASGIGRAIAERCVQDGYEPIILDKQDADIVVDLASPSATEDALSKAVRGGDIHRLVNNVGIVRAGTLSEITVEDLEAAVSVNIRCAIQCMQALSPHMQRQGFGRVVNISSRTILGKPGRSVYAGTKAALVSMTRTWALELGRHNVTVNAIAPGPIDTTLFRDANSELDREEFATSVPVGRVGLPADIANAASFFLGEDAGFVTGQVLFVCGGTSLPSLAF